MLEKSSPANKPQTNQEVAIRLAKTFGIRLQEVRRRQHWKQDMFAEAFGVSRTTMSNIERGEQRIYLYQVYKAASILNVPLEELLPPLEEIGNPAIFRTASDDPLTQAAGQQLADVINEINGYSNKEGP